MISLLRRYQKAIFVATLAIFFGGTFVGFGGYWFTSRDNVGVVARIGKEKIMLQTLNERVDLYADRLREKGTELDDAKLSALKREMLNNMMVEEMLSIKADELGIAVTDEELAHDIHATPAFSRSGQFDQEVYFATIRATFKQTAQQYELDRRKSIKTSRLKSFFYRAAKVSPTEIHDLYGQANKGSFKNFEKDKNQFAQQLQQQRALELINQCLRQMQTQVEVQNLIDKVENGV